MRSAIVTGEYRRRSTRPTWMNTWIRAAECLFSEEAEQTEDKTEHKENFSIRVTLLFLFFLLVPIWFSEEAKKEHNKQ